MVSVSETVIHEGAVMIEVFHAFVANRTVERSLWPDDLTMGAKVVQM